MKDIFLRARTTRKRNPFIWSFLNLNHRLIFFLIHDALFNFSFTYYFILINRTTGAYARSARGVKLTKLNAGVKLDDMSRSRVVRLRSLPDNNGGQDPMAEISTGSRCFHRASAPSRYRRPALPSSYSVRACRGLWVLSQSVALDVGGKVLSFLFWETAL